MSRIDETLPFIPVRIAVLTMSDTRTPKEDKSGNLLADMIRESGHVVVDRGLVKDDIAQIRSKVQSWVDDPSIDVIISTGGTGFTGRDVTPEATEAVRADRRAAHPEPLVDGEHEPGCLERIVAVLRLAALRQRQATDAPADPRQDHARGNRGRARLPQCLQAVHRTRPADGKAWQRRQRNGVEHDA